MGGIQAKTSQGTGHTRPPTNHGDCDRRRPHDRRDDGGGVPGGARRVGRGAAPHRASTRHGSPSRQKRRARAAAVGGRAGSHTGAGASRGFCGGGRRSAGGSGGGRGAWEVRAGRWGEGAVRGGRRWGRGRIALRSCRKRTCEIFAETVLAGSLTGEGCGLCFPSQVAPDDRGCNARRKKGSTTSLTSEQSGSARECAMSSPAHAGPLTWG